MKKVTSRQLEIVQYERHCARRDEQAQSVSQRFPKIRLIMKGPVEPIPAIKLKRTDTTH